jgi:hypothetical protein
MHEVDIKLKIKIDLVGVECGVADSVEMIGTCPKADFYV